MTLLSIGRQERGYLKTIVYVTPLEIVNELTERIFTAFDTIRAERGILQRVRRNIVCRCTLCNEVGGRHFEYLLYM
ncbi:hypothetical protein ANN_15395 [Periplaneta americana]|uniref:Uncharacterized protein n=1 Tax=Periplaneta americana TaxID=6978 RepID=A0ABQ8SGA2_PERAM|nr:hypothetical protein ANN_15395 [Periplaneta americana]